MSDAITSGVIAGMVPLIVALLAYRRQGQSLTATPYGDMVTNVKNLTERTDVLEKRDDQHRAQIDVLIRRDTIWRQWADATRAACVPFHPPADLPTLPPIPRGD